MDKESQCLVWLNYPDRNPITGRKIDVNAKYGIYAQWARKCKKFQTEPKSRRTTTRRPQEDDCAAWLKNKLENPRTGRKIQENKGVYRKYQRECLADSSRTADNSSRSSRTAANSSRSSQTAANSSRSSPTAANSSRSSTGRNAKKQLNEMTDAELDELLRQKAFGNFMGRFSRRPALENLIDKNMQRLAGQMVYYDQKRNLGPNETGRGKYYENRGIAKHPLLG